MADYSTADLAAVLMGKAKLGPNRLMPGEMPANAKPDTLGDILSRWGSAIANVGQGEPQPGQRGGVLPLMIGANGQAELAAPESLHRLGQIVSGEVQPDASQGDAMLVGGLGAVPNMFGARGASVPRQPTPPPEMTQKGRGQTTTDWLKTNQDRILQDLESANGVARRNRSAADAEMRTAYAAQDDAATMANQDADVALAQALARARTADALDTTPRLTRQRPVDYLTEFDNPPKRFPGGQWVDPRAVTNKETGVDNLISSRMDRMARDQEGFQQREIMQDNMRPKPAPREITPEAMRDAYLTDRINPNQQMYTTVPGTVTDHLSNDTIRSVMRLANEATDVSGGKVAPDDVLNFMQGQGYNMGWYRQHRGQGGVRVPYPAGEQQDFRDINRRLLAMALGQRAPIVDAGVSGAKLDY